MTRAPAAPRPSTVPRREPAPPRVEEFVVEATTAALNAALADLNLDAAHVIAVLPLQGTPLAGGRAERFRVLYRT
jgi:hypothetical protein